MARSRGRSAWVLYPFWAIALSFMLFANRTLGLVLLGVWILGFPLARFWMSRSSSWTGGYFDGHASGSHGGWWTTRGGRFGGGGGGFSSGGFSGGGGSFGGGGASGSW